MAKSDGGSSSYYQKVIPAGVLKISGGPFDGQPLEHNVIMETDDVIKLFLGNDWHKGNIFKAMTRLGQKEGIDETYDFNKIRWFLDRIQHFNVVKENILASTPIAEVDVPPVGELYDSMYKADPIMEAIKKKKKNDR